MLLDNFEDLVDPATQGIHDAELDEALRALLNAGHHAVKVILTTRVAPRDLALIQPGRQCRLELDEGLPSPFAENILREMDRDGKVGLKAAAAGLLDRARVRTRGYPRGAGGALRHPLGRPLHHAGGNPGSGRALLCPKTWWRRWWARRSTGSTRPASA